jgi:hypothetical protein
MCRPLGENESARANFRSSIFYLAEAIAECWKCSDETKVYCILLNNDYQEREDRRGAWTDVKGSPVLLYDVEVISKTASQHIAEITGNRYRLDYSQTIEASYFMNHCESCGIRQGDYFLHDQMYGAFLPRSHEEVAAISLRAVEAELETYAAGSDRETASIVTDYFFHGVIPEWTAEDEEGRQTLSDCE